MLKQLRQKKTAKKVLWGLAIIIIPAFVLWGAGGLRESTNYAGTVFGKKVSYEEYRAAFNAMKNKALLTYGNMFHQVREQLNLEGAAWEHIILLREAKRQKIKVVDQEVVARIASFPFFRDAEGKFSQNAYTMVLNNAFRTTPRTFEEEIRQMIIIEKLIQDVVKNAPEPTEHDITEAIKREEILKKDTDKKKKKDKKDTPEETSEEKHARLKENLWATHRMAIYRTWRSELLSRANLVSNLVSAEEEKPADQKAAETSEGKMKVEFQEEETREE